LSCMSFDGVDAIGWFFNWQTWILKKTGY
jgi:hypothetical protein